MYITYVMSQDALMRWGHVNFVKAVTKQEGPKHFLAAPKMVSFFAAGSWEKDAILGAARKIFNPSYFVTALETNT